MCKDDGSASGWEVITSVRRFQHRMEVFMDQSLEPLGVTFAQYRALEAVDLNREMHISELARFLRLSRQAVQMTVHKLQDVGLVDLIQESGRVYVRTSELGLRRLRLFRRFTCDFKVKLEEERSRTASAIGSRSCLEGQTKPSQPPINPNGGSHPDGPRTD